MNATYSRVAAMSSTLGFQTIEPAMTQAITTWTPSMHGLTASPTPASGQSARPASIQQHAFMKLASHIIFGVTTMGLIGQHSETFTPVYDLAQAQVGQKSNDVLRRYLRDVAVANPAALMRVIDLTRGRFPAASISYRVEADADMDSSSLLLMDIDTAGMPIDEQMDLELNLHRAIKNDPAMRAAKRHILINVF